MDNFWRRHATIEFDTSVVTTESRYFPKGRVINPKLTYKFDDYEDIREADMCESILVFSKRTHIYYNYYRECVCSDELYDVFMAIAKMLLTKDEYDTFYALYKRKFVSVVKYYNNHVDENDDDELIDSQYIGYFLGLFAGFADSTKLEIFIDIACNIDKPSRYTISEFRRQYARHVICKALYRHAIKIRK